MDWIKIVGIVLYTLVVVMVAGFGVALTGGLRPSTTAWVERPEQIEPSAGPAIRWGSEQAARRAH